MQTSAPAGERTGWRDEALSLRHRRWGFNLPGVDLDFVMLEYHLSRPVALIEYKHQAAAFPDFKHPTYAALCALADRHPVLPLFVVRYWPDTWAFEMHGVNELAKGLLGDADERRVTEQQFVTFLHHLRSVAVQEQVIARLNTELPPPKLRLVKTSPEQRTAS